MEPTTTFYALYNGFVTRKPEIGLLIEEFRAALRDNNHEKIKEAVNGIRLNCPLNLLYEVRKFCFLFIIEEGRSETKKEALEALSLPTRITFPISVYDVRLVEENTKSEGTVDVHIDNVEIDSSGRLSIVQDYDYGH